MSTSTYSTATEVEEAAEAKLDSLYRYLADEFSDDRYEYEKAEARALKQFDDWWGEARSSLPESEQIILAANNGESVNPEGDAR